MISARRAALLGLDVPLSAIMVAVLGLWPEAEEVDDEPLPQVFGGGRRRTWAARRGAPAIEWVARARPTPEPARRSDPVDPDAVRRAWDEIDALRRKPATTRQHSQEVGEVVQAPAPVAVEANVAAHSQEVGEVLQVSADHKRSEDAALVALLIAELA